MPQWLEDLERVLSQISGNNEPLRVLLASVLVLVLMGGGRFFSSMIARRVGHWSSSSDTPWDDVVARALLATRTWFFLCLGLGLFVGIVNVPARFHLTIEAIVRIAIIVQIGIWIQVILNSTVDVWREQTELKHNRTALSAIQGIGRLLVWSIALVVVLSNMGVEVSGLIAGLGVGGVAAALAVQSLLGDVFSALFLFADRPFDIGDFVAVDGKMGVIRYIGWRTTRMASLSGEEIIFPNSDLTRSRIHNYARMKQRRVSFNFGVVYSTSPDMLEKIPGIIQETIQQTTGTEFNRAHFTGFGESALTFEAVFYVVTPMYEDYLDAQQKIMLSILRKLQEHKIELAFPTRTIHVVKDKEISK